MMASALECSRLVSMTFIPLLGYYFLRPSKMPEATIEERRERGFTGYYYRLAGGPSGIAGRFSLRRCCSWWRAASSPAI